MVHHIEEVTRFGTQMSSPSLPAQRSTSQNTKLVQVLRQDSEIFEAQPASFSAISKDIPLACIYETRPVAGIGIVSVLS